MSNIIEIEGLEKRYGKRTVLSVPQMVIPKGSITGIIGPSGAGKSTLLRIINRLEQPTQGKVLFSGCNVWCEQEKSLELQRKMTMVFQKPTLLDRSVYDNVAIGLVARKENKKETEEKVMAALQTVGMQDFRHQKAKTLSGGESQRVAFARAMVLDPDVLLLDEPTANLDPANVRMLEKYIKTMNEEKNTTVMMVTHNLFQAKRIATHVAFLYEGNLVEWGSTPVFFETPQQQQTLDFLEGKIVY